MRSLKTQVLLILALVFVLYATINLIIQRVIIFPNFVTLERDEAQKDVERVVQAIHNEIHHLNALTHDWAAWDDTYKFVQSPFEEYTKGNLNITAFTINSLNLIYIIGLDGKVVWGQIRDLTTEAILTIGDFPQDAWPRSHPLLSYNLPRHRWRRSVLPEYL